MSVSDEDRKDYEKGQDARRDDWLGQALRSTIQTEPDSEAYDKGLHDEQLDEEDS